MGAVSDFETELLRRSTRRYAQWHRVDLHNHSPASHDYGGDPSTAAARTAEQIVKTNLSVVMFTDHERLPEVAFVSEVAEKSGRVIIPGVELNIFVDAWDIPASKVGKNLFFHLLVGFDPEGELLPQYWLDHIYREGKSESRRSGKRNIRGITARIDELSELLKDANAIMIPAHLHSTPDAFRSRSIDDIYTDPAFLTHVRDHFTALEVTSLKTAEFFDGEHEETRRLRKTCVRSSDSHDPDGLGSRPCFVQMERPSFQELKAALELPFRTSLEIPREPSSFIIGLHIHGDFFPDLWLSLSPHCNVLMGIKGTGKTSVLESLRFVLGAEVPQSKVDSVREHLSNILGPNGRVRVLVRREDGARILVERSRQEEKFKVTFENDREDYFATPEGLLFTSYILGWHEIEQAATDVNIRRFYLDTIAGRQEVRRLEEEAKAVADQIRHKHDVVANKYSTFRSLHEQVERLDELRRGLKELTDAHLIELRNQYEAAVKHRDQLSFVEAQMILGHGESDTRLANLLPGIGSNALSGESPLSSSLHDVTALLENLVHEIGAFGVSHKNRIQSLLDRIKEITDDVQRTFDRFYTTYH